MSPWVQDHAPKTMHCNVQSNTGQMLIQYIPDDSGFDFREGAVSSVDVGASTIAGTDGVPDEIVVTVAVNSWAHTTAGMSVGGAGLAPETGLEVKTNDKYRNVS